VIVDNEGQMMRGVPYGNGTVYEMSYSLLLPKYSEATNILFPVCNSATHVAYGSIRVEPSFMQLGQASGVAAALANFNKVAVQNVSIKALQAELVKQGQYIHWPPTSC